MVADVKLMICQLKRKWYSSNFEFVWLFQMEILKFKSNFKGLNFFHSRTEKQNNVDWDAMMIGIVWDPSPFFMIRERQGCDKGQEKLLKECCFIWTASILTFTTIHILGSYRKWRLYLLHVDLTLRLLC